MNNYKSNNNKLIFKKNSISNSYKILIAKGPTNKVIEKIGTFDNKNKKLLINKFRLSYWLSKNIKIHWKLFFFINYFGLYKAKF